MPQPKAAQTLEQKFDQNCHPFYDLGFEHVRETMHGMELRLQGLRGELAATAKEARARQGELQAVNARLEAATTESIGATASTVCTSHRWPLAVRTATAMPPPARNTTAGDTTRRRGCPAANHVPRN